ncbi:MAG: collagen-binding domain-containing protein [Erysipelotrichaceae bacterium]|nr:collagen-binding domain-containing protein [Erysipelotrichaceae bacterium]
MNHQFRKVFCSMLALLIMAGMSRTVRAEESTDTFESDGGRYDLGYILEHYNVFVSGDYSGTHVVGPVICGGNFGNYFGGLSYGNPAGFPHEVPSWFGKDIVSANFNTYSDVTTYVGSQVDMSRHWKLGADGMVHNEQVKVSDRYADFARMEDLKEQAASLGKEADRTISQADLQNGQTISLETGHIYKIEPGISLKGYSIRVSGNASEDLILESDAAGTVYLPSFVLNSDDSEFGSIENQESGAGIVFAFPNASEVTNEGYGHSITGHIVAPFADISLTGGNYNGCIIAASVKTNSEGHMWSYHGKKLLPNPTPEPTATPEVTPVPSTTPEPTATPEVTPVPSATPAPTATPEVTPVPSATPEPTATPVPSPTPEPTATPEVTPVPSATPAPTATPEVTPVPSATPEPTATPEVTPVPSTTPAPTATPEATPVPSATPKPDPVPSSAPAASAPSEKPITPDTSSGSYIMTVRYTPNTADHSGIAENAMRLIGSLVIAGWAWKSLKR